MKITILNTNLKIVDEIEMETHDIISISNDIEGRVCIIVKEK